MLHLTKDDFICNYFFDKGGYGEDILRVELESIEPLSTEADRIQKMKGELPLFDYSGDYDDEDWYNFYLVCDMSGFVSLTFDYGLRDIDEYVDIEIDDESKQNAFEKMVECYGGYDEYVNYFIEEDE